jgi:hypothetical protein
MRTIPVIVALVVAACGCSKGTSPDPAPAPSAASAAPPASAARTVDAAAPAASGGAAATAAGGKAASYGGTYSLVPATLYIPEAKDYASVKQVKDDPSKHVGDGALALEVDANGRVTGTIESGPASPAVIDGSVVGDEIRGNVRRKTPSDDGLTGTVVAKLSGDTLDGKLRLAESNAAIVREGKLALKKK